MSALVIPWWMNDVAAAWMMTSLTTVPLFVALVQTAGTPVLPENRVF